MPYRLLRKERLEGLSDGVIAVVITLMFLGFEQSYQQIRDASSSNEIWAYLASEWPRFRSYCLSFLFIGGYWIKQHLIFHYVQRADRIFVSLNLLFLMCIAFIPVATDWLVESENHEFNAIIFIYGVANTISSLALLGVWEWSAHKHRLIEAQTRVATIRSVRLQIWETLLGTLLGVGISFVNIHAGLIALVIASFVALWPRRTDGHWMEVGPPSAAESPTPIANATSPSILRQIWNGGVPSQDANPAGEAG